MKRSALLILASVAVFASFGAVSIATYPGGSWLDRSAIGHDLARNFLCDLLGPVAINGEPNPTGSRAMAAGMALFALGLGVAWWTIPSLFASVWLTRAIRVCGVVATVGMLCVPLTPPTESYQLHAAAIFGGGIPTFAAWILCLVGLARVPSTRGLAGLGLAALAMVAVGFGFYAREYFFGGGPTVLLPLSHRVATVFFLAWVIAVALRLGKQPVEVRA